MTKRRTNIYIDNELAPIVDELKSKLFFGTDLEVIKYALRAVGKIPEVKPSESLKPEIKLPELPTVTGPLHWGSFCPIHKSACILKCGCIKNGKVKVLGIDNSAEFE